MTGAGNRISWLCPVLPFSGLSLGTVKAQIRLKPKKGNAETRSKGKSTTPKNPREKSTICCK